ncbi:hypothetical protein [Phenylobacterium sp.]|jgi:hypothetical protein|uniref:hypothetical protein n=1 Tax=Phenylobacterium sp. TaxID=1871053 RepID=UPI002F956889
MLGVFRSAAVMVLAAALASALPQAAAAQSSTQRMIRVPFSASTGDGYAGGSVGVQYAFLGCYGELHLALRLAPNSVQTNGVYRMGGKTYAADGAPTQLSVVKVRGRAARAGSEIIGDFTNGAVGPEGGLGCFSGDLTQLGVLTRWLGPKPTQEQIVNFLNSLTLQVEPIEGPRNAGLEAKLRSEERQKQAAVEAQEKAAKQQAEAKRVAEAKRAEEAKRPVSLTPTGAGGGYASNAPTAARPAPAPPQLSEAERIAKAIESDRLLAQQRLAQQQQQYNQFQQQMAANEAESLRQAQAVIAAAPALAALGSGLEDMINGPWYRAKERQFQAAQAKLAGQCFVPGTSNPAPRNGLLRFGITHSSRLEKADCGYSSAVRFRAFMLVVDTPGRATFTLGAGGGLQSGRYALHVANEHGSGVLTLRGAEYRPFQRSLPRAVQLTPGVYTVTVSNYYEFEFLPFDLRVDFIDANGRAVVEAKPAPAPAQTSAPQPPPALASSGGAAGAPNAASAQLWGTLAELGGREWAGAGLRHRFVWSDGGRTLSWQQASKQGAWYDWYVFSQDEADISVRLAGGRSRGTVSVDPTGVAVARVGSFGATTRFARNGDGFDVVFRPIPITWQLTPASNGGAGEAVK